MVLWQMECQVLLLEYSLESELVKLLQPRELMERMQGISRLTEVCPDRGRAGWISSSGKKVGVAGRFIYLHCKVFDIDGTS